MINLKESTCPTREQRAGGINAYCGKASQLVKDAIEGNLVNRERHFQQNSGCILNFYLTVRVATIRDAVMIIHAPVGCSAPASLYREVFRRIPVSQGRPEKLDFHWLTTNISEKDVIYGAALTAPLCPTYTDYLSKGLEQEYGVPYFLYPSPIGIANTDEWLRTIGRYVGKEKEVENLIAEEHKIWVPKMDKLRSSFESLKEGGNGFSVLGSLGQGRLLTQTPFFHEFKDGEKPVIYASTAGFKGNNYQVHEWVLESIFQQYLKPSEKTTKGLVNIWAGIPLHDPFWLGNLIELEKLVEELGLIPNTIFGYGKGLKNIDKIPEAQFNLLVSPWLGLNSVKLLEEKFNTPYLHYPTLPIGAYETSKFLKAVGEFASIEPAKVESVIKENENKYYYYIERFADVFLETRVMSKRFAVVSDSLYALALTKFLVNDVGLYPSKQYITDNPPSEFHNSIKGYFKDLNYGIKADIDFQSDGFIIHEDIKKTDFHGYPLIIGSSWEKKVAQQTAAHYLSISWPMNERLVINSSYVGYGGGLKFLEDIYSVVLTRFN